MAVFPEDEFGSAQSAGRRLFEGQATALLILLAVCLACWLPGFFDLPPVDRDEARWAQTSRQLLEEQEWWQLRFQQEPRMKKPPGGYWLQAAAVRLLSSPESGEIWPYRVPSLLSGIAAVLGLYLLGSRCFSPCAAFWAACLMASSLLLGIQVRLAKADALLLAAAVFCLGSLAWIYCRLAVGEAKAGPGSPAHRGMALIFWLSLAAAALLKGPFLPCLAALAVAALLTADRSLRLWHALYPIWGVPLSTLATLAWLIPLETAAGPAGYLREGLLLDVLQKMNQGAESHFFPPGFYLASFWLFFFPGSLAAGVAVWQAWRHRRRPEVRVGLAWLLPGWLFLELMPTKLPHYALPLYPAVALLVGWVLTSPAPLRAEAWQPRWVRFGRRCWILAPLLLGLGLPALAWYLGEPFDWGRLAASLPLLAGAAISVRQFGKTAPHPGLLIPALAGWWVFSLIAWQLILPGWDSLWLSRSLTDAARVHNPEGPQKLHMAIAGYHEPSVVFAAGSATQLCEPERAAEALADRSATLATISEPLRDRFLRRCDALEIRVRQVDRVRGWNYSKGEWLTLLLFQP